MKDLLDTLCPRPLIVGALCALLLGACNDESTGAQAPGTPRIAASFYPLAFFVEEIAGDTVELYEPVPTGEDPAFWKPDSEALVRMQGAQLILLNGAKFEKWVETVSLPESRIVYTARSFEEQWLEREEETHSHGGLAPHSHGAIDGHTWMDPHQATAQAEAVMAALSKRLPTEAEHFASGMQSLMQKLEEIDLAWSGLAPRLKQARLLASHPSYDYPARRYGFTLANFDLDPEAALGEHDLESIIDTAGSGSPHIMLWESSPLPETAEALAKHGIRSVTFSPGESLARAERGQGVDFHTIMLDNLKRLGEALAD